VRRYFAAVALALGAMAIATMAGCGKSHLATESSADEPAAKAVPVEVATATRDSIEHKLELSGTIQASDSVNVVPETMGKVAAVYVDVGDRVGRGQRLVRIDTELAVAQRDQAAAGVSAAQARFAQATEARDLTDEQTRVAVRQAEVGLETAREMLRKARTAARLQESVVESNIEQARMGVRSAETRLAEVKAGARAQQRRQAEEQVTQAKAALDLARQTYERHQRLFDKGVIPAQQLDQVRTQYEVAQAQHNQAVQALSLVEEGARTEQVQMAELGVEQAKEQLRLAEAARDRVEIAKQDVATAEQGVRQAQETLTAARANRQQVALRERDMQAAAAAIGQAASAEKLAAIQVEKASIYAPIAGTIAARYVDPGEGASPGMPVLTIVNNDLLYLEVSVSEEELAKIEVGRSAEVRADAVPDRTFTGYIYALNPAVHPASRTGSARISIGNPSRELRAGMFARASIVVEELYDVIVVPREAVFSEQGKQFAYVVEGGAAEKREVEVGMEEEARSEIVSGIEAGDQLVVLGQHLLKQGQRVKVQPRRGRDAR